MTTAIDSNVITALMNPDDALNIAAASALSGVSVHGKLVVPAPVYAELLAAPNRTEGFLDAFLSEAGVTVDWDLDEFVWRTAGRAFHAYAARRRKHGSASPRHILTDFLIGAYAARHGFQLLTLDQGLYRAAFPDLKIVVA
jgi:predicted nucleic acid-binding protein